MKKIIFLIITFLFSISVVSAKNNIYSIDIKVYLDEEGNANIEEVWNVKGSDGTEWYKVLSNLGNMELSNFKVYMDGNLLTYKTWDVDESLSEKKGYYGINKTYNSLELCFGKYDYKSHTFKLEYELSNFVFNTDDAQVIYYNFIDKLSNVNFDNFTLEISSFYDFPDTLDVWGYGYKGYAYVYDGKIYMSNESNMDDNYVVLLVKFPLNTFNTTNTTKYDTFDEVYNKAEQGTFDYDYSNTLSNVFNFIFGIINVLLCFLPFIIVYLIARSTLYGYKDNKKITKKNTPLFRDIPCNKDIYYANALASLNNWTKSSASILGAILLKWIKEDKVRILKEKSTKIVLNKDIKLDIKEEQDLYDMMYKASGDGILESKELEKWARKNYSKYLNLFDKIKNNKIRELKEQGHIYKRTNRKECKYKNVMDDVLYEDSKKLYGLKLFLEEFSKIDTKEAIEVKLWDEYLMFAYIFGIADKVAKQFKNLYPEYIENLDNVDFDTIIFLNTISTRSVSAASVARSRAQSYSSGGGGFSSGGGGGGSFGGGGGGSR